MYAVVKRSSSTRSPKRSRSREERELVAALLPGGGGHHPVLDAVDDLDGLALLVDPLGVPGPRGDDEGGAVDLTAGLEVAR